MSGSQKVVSSDLTQYYNSQNDPTLHKKNWVMWIFKKYAAHHPELITKLESELKNNFSIPEVLGRIFETPCKTNNEAIKLAELETSITPKIINWTDVAYPGHKYHYDMSYLYRNRSHVVLSDGSDVTAPDFRYLQQNILILGSIATLNGIVILDYPI